MNEEKREFPGKEKRFDRGRAKAAFYEELLCCYTCGKIYFTRYPIRLRTPGRKSFHVCIECSRSLICSACGEDVTARTAIVIENHPEYLGGFLCPECRNRVLLGLAPQPRRAGGPIRSAILSVKNAISKAIRRITRIRLVDGRRRG